MGWLFPDEEIADNLNDKNNWLFPEEDKNKSEVQKELDKKKLFDPELFKPTPILNPDGSTLNLGAVKLSDDGSSMVINDKSTINTLLIPDIAPITNNQEDFDFWMNQKKKKSELLSQGYSLVNIDTQDYYYPEGSKEVKKRNAFDAIAEGAKNLDFVPFIGNYIDIAELNNMYHLSVKFDKGTITDEEHEELYNFVEKNNEEYENTFMAGVFDVLMKTPAFMGEMGGGWLLKEGVKGITKAGLKRVLSQNFKKKVKNSFNKRLTSNIVTKGPSVKGFAPLKGLVVDKKQIAKGVADASLVTVLGAETGGMVQVGALEKYLNPRYQFDTDDMLMLSKEAISYDKAKTRARFDTYVEYMSEQTGGAIRWLGSPIKKNIQERLMTVGLYKALKKSNPSASAKDIRKIFETLGYHGIMEEMMEERVGEFARGIGYQLSKAGVLNDLDDPSFEYKAPSGKQLLTELVAFAVPGGVMKASTKIKDEYELSKVRGTKAYKSLQEARESGEYSEEALDMTEQFIRKNPNIDETTVLKFTGEALTVTKKSLSKGGIHHYLVEESGAKDANDLIAREGLDPNKYDDTTPLAVKGQTKLETMVDGTTKVLISLSNKADANTVIEEFYGNSYKTLSEQDKTVFDEFYDSQDTKMSRQEFFEKEGVKYFNNEGLYKETAIGKVFRKFKQYLQDIFGKANLPKDIRKFYDEAGLGGKVTEKKTSFQLDYAVKDIPKIDLPKKSVNLKILGKHLSDYSKQYQLEKGIDLSRKITDKNPPSEEMYEEVSNMLANEIKEEYDKGSNAVGWYSEKVQNLYNNIALKHPKIKTDINHETAFKIALAITSNGTAVKDNLRFAIRNYEYWIENGSLPTHFEDYGKEFGAINQGFELYNNLIEEWGLELTNDFLNHEFTSKEINDIGTKVINGFKSTSEKAQTVVPGSIIFGPKIGGGFYANINGMYNYLTMDRWFMRTLGRLRGDLVGSKDPTVQLREFKKYLKRSKASQEKYGVKPEDFNDESKLLAIAEKVHKAFAKADPKTGKTYTKANKLNNASRNLVKRYDLKDSPQNASERDFMREVMSRAVDKTGIKDITMADAQAILWFREKDIYSKFKRTTVRERESDYETESIKWAESQNLRQPISTRKKKVDKGVDAISQKKQRSFQLTPKQKEYFKDSKVVDEKGNPKVVYHGTGRKFDRFGDEQLTGSNPFYFTPSPEVATAYADHRAYFGGGNAQIIPVYINLTNPLLLDMNLNDKITNSQFVELIESATGVKIPKGVNIFDYYLADELSSFDTDTRKKAMDEFDKNLFDYFDNNPDIQTYLTSIGYDGIETWEADPSSKGSYPKSKTKDSTVYIAFKPEQIKSVYNKDPKSTGRSFSLEPTYFSTATRAVDKLSQSTQKQIKPQAVKSFLKKNQVKDEEIEFLNLEEYLSNYKPNERIPVEELAKFIKSNEVKITEIERKVHTFKGYDDGSANEVFVNDEGYKLKFDIDTELYKLLDPDGQMLGEVDFLDIFPFKNAQKIIDRQLGKTVSRIRHEEYQLDGEKEDYREITLSIPELEGPAYVREEHWEEPNVIASVRMNTRYINNKKVLFIEELQSDIHTQGAKRGYRTVPLEVKKRIENIKKQQTDLENEMVLIIEKEKKDKGVKNIQQLLISPLLERHVKKGQQLTQELESINQEYRNLTINAPYKGFDWVSLSLKRILRHGAENNFDEIAFINAEQVIDRWDLSKRVEYLAYDKRDVKGQPRLTVRGVDIDGKDFNLGVLETPQKLESLLGKGVVDKMLKGDGLKGGRGAKSTRASFAQKYETVLEGDDLKIKSRYMIDLYTNQIPQRLKKLTKKLGGRVGSVSLIDMEGKLPLPNEEIYMDAIKVVTKKLAFRPRGSFRNQYLVDANHMLQKALIQYRKDGTSPGWIANPNVLASKYITDARKDFAKNNPHILGGQKSISITPKMKEKFIHSQRSFQLEEAKSNLEIPNETTLQYVQRAVQDKLNRLDQVQKKIGIDQDELDAYMKADLFTSKATDRIDKVDEFLVDSNDAFFKRLEDDGFSIDDLSDYMYAKHAKERNKHIKDNINPENKNGSGMTNKDANAILKRFDKKIDGYAKEFRSEIIDKRLQILKDSGLISEDSYNLFTSGKIFKNYVPLKGTARGESIPMTGKGYNVTGKDIKGIKKGRTTKAENPVVQAIVDLNESIIRSEKNEVGKSLIKLIKEHPDITLENGEKLWETKGLKYLPRYDQNGEVEYMDPRKLRTNELMYWEDGKAKVVAINDDALYEGLANIGVGKSVPYLIELNNYLRMINTTLNPNFLITNFQRDAQMAMLQLSTNQSGKIARKTAMSLFPAMRGIRAVLRDGKRKDVWTEAYKDFIEQGGKIGWIDQGTVGQKVEQLKKKISSYSDKGNIKGSIRVFARFIEDYNSVIESSTRLSAYKTLVDSGVSKEKASQIAKNMTVNFNKKGQWGVFLNTLYLFYNASVQGGFNILKTLKTKKGITFAMSLGVAGFLQSFLNRNFGPDPDEWDEVSDYEKDTKWLFKIPGIDMKGYIPIMLPYGYNTFVASGRIAEEMAYGDLQPYQAWGRMLNALNNAFNPIGGGTPLQMIVPTFGDLPAQMYEGKDWKGDDVYPRWEVGEKPFSEVYFPSVRQNSMEIAKKLNEVTGGNEIVQGVVSISPEFMDLTWDYSTGGMGKFIANAIETGTMLSQGKTPDIRNIPIARKFYTKRNPYVSKQIARELLDKSKLKKLSDKEKNIFKRRMDLANKSGSLSDEQTEDMFKEMEKNQKKLNAPRVEIKTVYKIDKMYKRLKRNDLSQQEMDELWELVEDSYLDEYITKRKKKNIQKMIQAKEK